MPNEPKPTPSPSPTPSAKQQLTILQRIKTLPEPPVSPKLTGFVEKPKVDYITPAVLYGLANGADLASTEYALSKNPRVVEANPLMQGGTAQRALIKAGTTAALTAADTELQRSGHKDWAKGLRLLASGLLGGLSMYNLSNANKKR